MAKPLMKRTLGRQLAAGAGLMILFAPAAFATLDDDAAARPRALARTVIRASQPEAASDAAQAPQATPRFSVQGFKVEGNAQVSDSAIDAVLAPWKGRELSLAEFEQAIHAVARYLREHGHPGAQVSVSRTLVGSGMVAVAVTGLTPPPVVAVEPRIEVKGFRFSGVTVASEAELQAALAPQAGKELTTQELQASADTVAALVRAKGYPLAQAYLPRQRIDDGIVEIAVQEGIVDGQAGHNGIVVSGAGERIKPEVIENLLARGVTPGAPLKLSDLDRQVRIANDLPGVKQLNVNLEAGTQPGTTQVKATVQEAKAVSGAVWADNFGSPYTGANELNALLNLNSPAGYGEQYSLGLGTASGMKSVKLAVLAPVGTQGAKIGASASNIKLDIGKELVPLNLNSESTTVSLYGMLPLVRSATRDVYLSATLDDKRLVNNLQGVRDNERNIHLATLMLSGNETDRFDGRTSYGLSLAAGSVGIPGGSAYQVLDGQTAHTEGSYGKLLWNVARVAPFPTAREWSWYAAINGQFASKNLDSAEKFQLGGPNGVRAYPVGEALGDNGWLANLELRRVVALTSAGEISAYGFADTGHITQYRTLWTGAMPAGAPNSYSLSGYGIGAALNAGERGSLRVEWARKAGSNPNPTANNTDSDGSTRNGRVWIVGTVKF